MKFRKKKRNNTKKNKYQLKNKDKSLIIKKVAWGKLKNICTLMDCLCIKKW